MKNRNQLDQTFLGTAPSEGALTHAWNLESSSTLMGNAICILEELFEPIIEGAPGEASTTVVTGHQAKAISGALAYLRGLHGELDQGVQDFYVAAFNAAKK